MTDIQVAMIIHTYHPPIGGAERQLAALAPLLQTRGVKINVLSRRYPGLRPLEVVNGVTVHRLPTSGPKPLASLIFILTAVSLLQRLRPDLIHAHELLSPTTAAVLAKQSLDIPVVAKVLRGGTLGDIDKLKHKPFGKHRIKKFQHQVDAFVTISREVDAELAEIGIPETRRFFIPNGVDVEHFKPLSPDKKQALRARLGLPDAPIAIFTGRLSVEKRVDQLITIWPAIRAVHQDALLLMLGAGEEERSLKKIAGNGVVFPGLVEDVAPYLQAADLFVLPSATEGLSNALLEAMAVGLPVVATAVGGAPDVIDHGYSGWLVPPNSPAALQEASLMILGDTDHCAHLGCNGRERVVRDYALTATAGHLRALYDRLINFKTSRNSND